MKHVISLGAGVQSSALCLMADRGMLANKPVAAIFADTGDEPKAVYDYLAFLEENVSFPIIRTKHSDLGRDSLHKFADINKGAGSPPVFARKENGKAAMLSRNCTRTYKVRPTVYAVKKHIMGLPKQGRWPKTKEVGLWLGITTDEMQRMKESSFGGIEHHFPFIDELRMSRQDCIDWFVQEKLPVPAKSACFYCPYKSSASWKDLKENHNEEFQRAVAYDEALRLFSADKWGQDLFLHRSLRPLSEVDFPNTTNDDEFMGECDAMCDL